MEGNQAKQASGFTLEEQESARKQASKQQPSS
jgi:hypothetical protein